VRYSDQCFSLTGGVIVVFLMVAHLAVAGNFDTRLSRQADGTMMDGNTRLVWMTDGNTPSVNTCVGGKKTWAGAFEYVACLNSSNYLGHSNWRLPTEQELSTLGAAAIEWQLSIAATLNANGFLHMQNAYYWTSSGESDLTAVAVDMLWEGQSHPMNKFSRNHVLAVRTTEN
jgi:hypothetical protein